METRRSFTGRVRQRKTRWTVRVGEVVSRTLISVGGVGTIIAVTTVCVFLVWVVIPLFRPATIGRAEHFTPEWKGKRPLCLGTDEYREIGWMLSSDGKIQVFRLESGEPLESHELFPKRAPSAASSMSRDGQIAFGFADGTIQVGRLGFVTRFLKDSEIPAGLRDLAAGKVLSYDGGLVSRTPEGQLRIQKFKIELDEPIKPKGEPSAIVLLDLSDRSSVRAISALTADGRVSTNAVSKREDLITGEVVREVSGGELKLPSREGKGQPSHLLISGVGDNVFVIWQDGYLLRLNTRDLDSPTVAEQVDLLGKPGQTVTAVQFLLGKTSMLVGDSSGRIRVWFRIIKADAKNGDGAAFVPAHELSSTGVAVTAFAASDRTRLMAAGYADGRVRVYYVTSEKLLAEVQTERDNLVQGLAFDPKEDGFLAATPAGIWQWDMNPGHPETTLRSLFRPVWYEGYQEPAQVWQSSSGSDEFEPKFGLWPLIFGTLKASFYSLLIGVPLALLAAIYTSEFLEPRAKAIVKPTIELMASLPSVVLGFLAALVFAPFVEKILPDALTGFLTIPGAFLVGAYAWQFLPEKTGLRLAHFRFLFLLIAFVVGAGAALVVGPLLERLLFQGDLKGWLAGQHGSGTSGWLVILFPLFALAVSLASAQFVNPRLRQVYRQQSRLIAALVDVTRFASIVLVALVAAWVCGSLLNLAGANPRGTIVGTYVQRNALIVGFVMGFAVIPIVYTLAEDALSAVPEHLRAASLGCGATQWQTARRVIIPTAMSGLFSAVMIGLGRAVGETMIVLMAAGNTPVMEMNVFNGFRTLSANIAVELPEAVANSTHYRTLFLAAFVLFAMTFVVNTMAEVVRQRFRKKAYQL